MISLMGIDGGGYYSSHKTKKANLYQKKSARLQQDLARSMNFASTDMNDQLKKAQSCLKKVNTVETRLKIELERYDSTSHSVEIECYRRLAAFLFFVTMLGYIDSKINDERQRINFASHFITADDECNERRHYDEIDLRKEIIAKYLLDREEVLEDFKSTCDYDYEINELIEKYLKEAPAYLKLGGIYEECDDNFFRFDSKAHFINAYNIGFITRDYYGTDDSYENRINRYRKLFNDLSIHITNNKAELENVKELKKNKDFK